MTAKQLAQQIVDSTSKGDLFSVSIRTVTDREAVSFLVNHSLGEFTIRTFSKNVVQLERHA